MQLLHITTDEIGIAIIGVTALMALTSWAWYELKCERIAVEEVDD
jgi:Tfp pilus assembly protein PilE